MTRNTGSQDAQRDEHRPGPWGWWKDDAGSAMVEFTMLGVLLLVPLVYLILTASQIQAASYAAVGAADHAAHAFVQAASEEEAQEWAHDAAQRAAENMGVSGQRVDFSYTCHPTCMDRDAVVTVTITVDLDLPLTPPGVDMRVGTIDAQATRIFGGI
ncbi:hypothetical protein [Zhihengliuella flava]|uniref:Flp pilus assembly protein TadG n=1 Tax=Zhihengliuella flava TaxID=1285193 RepID=A0A931DBH6_9MICC|nr:hypothetical protein [Zhihengliuella flava]MBG6083685.1 Flp pilus assembly protein TadG [Zhihengliuella flava]